MLSNSSLIISEFMTVNGSTLLDRYGASSDWIEIYNADNELVSLDGWFLTDDPEWLDKWQFPSMSLPAGETLIVFASGLDRRTASQPHTNFELGSEGEFLALVRPDHSIEHAFAAAYPPQRADISYGIPFDENGPRLDNPQYFFDPTPNAPNQTGISGFSVPVTFSAQRGFYDQPFQLSLSTTTPLAQIRYTTDGSEPTSEHGHTYDHPFAVSTTTTIRAVAFADNLGPSRVSTQTFIFLDKVLQQDGAGLPEKWGYFDDRGPQPPARMTANYTMDQDIVNHVLYRDTLKDDLQSIPTLSIVLDPKDLWDFENGIYSNPLQRGNEWERPVSLEWIDTNGETAFEAQAGIQIHGGWGRRFSQTAKLSFRVEFKGRYGTSSLQYPMFGPEALAEFDELVLRAGFNDSWRSGDAKNTYLQDQWTRDTQRALGGDAPHHTYVHLYLNGMYWGLYSPTERPNAHWAAFYQGGDADEYDVVNTGGHLVDGSLIQWNRLVSALSPARFSYDKVEALVDIDAFIDYLIVNQYVGNWDWPQNNWYASRRRVDDGKWQFHSWDAEAAFQRGITEDRVSDTIQPAVGPSNLYLALRETPEFQRRFADRLAMHLYGNGLLTPAANAQRLRSLAAQIDRAIVGESARWGDGRDDLSAVKTRDLHWLRRIQELIDDYFPNRQQQLLDQYRKAKLFPNVAPPTFTPFGGAVAPESNIQLDAPGGDIFYTSDGTDPIDVHGNLSDTAIRLNSVDLVSPDQPARILVPSSPADATDWTQPDFDDTTWSFGKSSFGYETNVREDLISVPEGFDIRAAASDIRIRTMADAERLLAGEHRVQSARLSGVPYIDFQHTGRENHFADSLAFPLPGDYFAMQAHGTLLVRRSGLYTFGATVNDAVKLLIDNETLFETAPRSSTNDTFATVELTAGEHQVHLIMFQRVGSSSIEFHFAPGEKTAFDDDFLLVGDDQHRSFDSWIAYDLKKAMAIKNSTALARIPFHVDDVSQLDRLELRLRYGDGFVAYLNGTEIARAFAPETLDYRSKATRQRRDVDAVRQQVFVLENFRDVLNGGTNVLAIQGLNREIFDTDFLISPQLVGFFQDSSIHLSESALITSRVLVGDEWSAASQASFSLAMPASSDNLRISEIHYHPREPSDSERTAGFVDADDFEFIELVNIGEHTINLSAVKLQQVVSNGDIVGVAFNFSTADIRELAAGQYIVVVEDRQAFEQRYGTTLPVAGQWSGGLSNSGETIKLSAADQVIHEFSYADDWNRATDGLGPSLERINPREADLSRWAESTAWEASSRNDGTPGAAKSSVPGDVNHDGTFNSADLLQVMSAGEFEDGIGHNSRWEEGDWDGDGDFTSDDLILALAATPLMKAILNESVAAAMADETRWTDGLISNPGQSFSNGQITLPLAMSRRWKDMGSGKTQL